MATKKIVEKKTGEKYASKAAMAKHEKRESKAEMKKEYGKPKPPLKQVVSKHVAETKKSVEKNPKTGVEKKPSAPIKMKKC